MRWLGKVLLIVGCVLGIIVLAGVAYQLIGNWNDARQSPEPGRLVDVGGYRLKLDCLGKGKPTVVLDSGLGDILSEWQAVQGGVAEFTRVCSYDRAGYGDSDAGPMPRTSAQIATELNTLLKNAGEQPPYILVGHSFGGYNVRVFTGKYTQEVSGLVLVDSPQEDEYRTFPAPLQKFSAALLQRYRTQARRAPFLVDTGVARLMLRSEGGIGKYDYLILSSKYLKARASELENIRISAEEARLAGGIGDKPLIVLTSANTLGGTSISGLDDSGVMRYQRTWVHDLQPRLARLSTHGKQVILLGATHNVPAERPAAIIQAVREISAPAAAN